MLKTASKNLVRFIPTLEKTEAKPTTVNFTPLTKREYDEWQESLVEIKRNKMKSNLAKATELLFRKCLTADEKQAFILNWDIEGKVVDLITDRDQAVDLLMHCRSIDAINEIEAGMRGSFTLDEDEEKNSVGQ